MPKHNTPGLATRRPERIASDLTSAHRTRLGYIRKDRVRFALGARMSEPWLSADHIALHLGVTKDTVYSWIAAKGRPAPRVGRLWKFQASEVDDWVRGGGARSGA